MKFKENFTLNIFHLLYRAFNQLKKRNQTNLLGYNVSKHINTYLWKINDSTKWQRNNFIIS
jgi:hypothetical protein